VAQVLSREHQEEHIREQAYQWIKRMGLETPTPHRLTRQNRSAAHTFEQQLYESTCLAPSPVPQGNNEQGVEQV
jgi:hypothetical protein